jgi:hypothetical protein
MLRRLYPAIKHLQWLKPLEVLYPIP